jgi:metal-responsive CopG/Arc/MetJ family transcriptional regulator
MAIVNFAIPETVSKKVNQAVKTDGFVSRAEFFRFMIKDYFNNKESIKKMSEDELFEIEMNALADTIHRKLGGKKLPSPEDQLAGLF